MGVFINLHTKIKNIKGFTLIELMVTIAILSILVILMIGFFGDSKEQRRKENFYQDVEEIVTLLRRARSESIADTKVDNSDNAYGIVIAKDEDNNKITVTLFNDLSPDENTDPNMILNYFDRIIEEKEFEMDNYDLTFESAEPISDPGTTIDNKISFLFMPPNALLYIKNDDASEDEEYRKAELVFEYGDLLTRRICVHRVSRFFEISSDETCQW